MHLDTPNNSSVPAKMEYHVPASIFIIELNFIIKLKMRNLEKHYENSNCMDRSHI